MTARAEYVAGLRELADMLERHEDLPLPYSGHGNHLLWIQLGDYAEQKRLAATFARLIPGSVAKMPRDEAMDIQGALRGLRVCMIVKRDAVCERIVKGTKTVTIPARPAEPARTVEVDDVEWRCGSILSEAAS